ncbi:MAG: hypothetical protein WCK34_06395 [Bacteroidota bacterium]
MATMINTSMQSRSVYVHGVITGDGGIRVYTDPAYKMQQPLILSPGSPFQVNLNTIGQIFDANHLVFEGITKNQILYGNGIPEGDYTICLRAYDYQTGQPLSGDDPQGCSATFSITDIEPPVILNPVCDNTIEPKEPQSLLINWTRPPNCPVNTSFNVKMIEVLPSDRNVNDAMKSAVHPLFFETNTSQTTYILTPADPKLVSGKRYALAVTASDPRGKTNFRNKGMSEVCTFLYEKPEATYTPPKPTGQSVAHNLPPVPLQSSVQGRLTYIYDEGSSNGRYAVSRTKIKLVARYMKKENDGNYSFLGFTPSTLKTGVKDGDVLDVDVTGPDGSFSFSYFTVDTMGIKVLSNLRIVNPNNYGSAFFDIYRVLYVEIDGSQKEYYMNNLAFLYKNYPGEMTDMSNLAPVHVKSYQLDVKVSSPFENSSGNSGNTITEQVLKGAKVYILRKHIEPNIYTSFPYTDGWPKPSGKKTMYGMDVIAEATTDDIGSARFNNLVWHHDPNYTYYIYSKLAESDMANYTLCPDAPVAFDPVNPNPQYPDPSKYYYYPEFRSTHYVLALDKKLNMRTRYPTITGNVSDEYGQPLSNTYIAVSEYYHVTNGMIAQASSPIFCDNVTYSYDRNSYLNEFSQVETMLLNKACPSGCSSTAHATMLTQADGTFHFEDLGIAYNKTYNGSSWKMDPAGPVRKVFATCEGYSFESKTVKNGLAMIQGEKQNVPFVLHHGATIKGRVLDAETGEGVAAELKFVDEPKSYSCNQDGTFSNVSARLIPKKTQKLKVTAADYIDSILVVTVDQKETDLDNIRIYKKMRRIEVFVREKDTEKLISNAQVEIVDVMTTCKMNFNGHEVIYDCPMVKWTGDRATVDFSFENAGNDPNQVYTVKVSIPPDNPANYETKTISVKIPVSQRPLELSVFLDRATCISGHVYAGFTDSAVISKAEIFLERSRSRNTPPRGSGSGSGNPNGNGADENVSVSDIKGFYTLKNVPVRQYRQTVRAVSPGSQMIGDSVNWYMETPLEGCYSRDFHLRIYKDMDITSLMGFPIFVTSLKDAGAGQITISGAFTRLKGNDQFSVFPDLQLHFSGVTIRPSDKLKNGNNIPVSVPVVLPVKTTANTMKVNVFNNFSAVVYDKKTGIGVDKTSDMGMYGAIKGNVRIGNTNFNTGGFTFPGIFLASGDKPGTDKLRLTVLNGDSSILYPNSARDGFNLCDTIGNALKYSLQGFNDAAIASLGGSLLKTDALVLNTTLQTNIPSGTGGEKMKVELGGVSFYKNQPFSASGTTALTAPMGTWTLTCKDWKLDKNGLILNHSVIKTGLDVPCDNIGLTCDAINTSKATVNLGEMKIVGGYAIKVPDSPDVNKGLAEENSTGNQRRWRIYACGNNSSALAGYIEGLPSLGSSDRIKFDRIRLYSDGSQDFMLKQEKVRVNKLADFTPAPGQMQLTQNSLKFGGVYNLGIPNGDDTKDLLAGGACEYLMAGGKLQFNPNSSIEQVHFKRHNVDYHFTPSEFNEQHLIAKGSLAEPGTLPQVKATLSKSDTGTVINIDPGEKIPFGASTGDKYLSELTGQLKVVKNRWDTLWYEGAMTGMKGISENKNRFKFRVLGGITAEDQKISITGISAIPGLSIVYDYANSRLTGTFDQTVDYGPWPADCHATLLFDGAGWYFEMGGSMEIPILPGLVDAGGEFLGILGDYPALPPVVTGKYGAYKCLPSSFQNRISGFLLQAGGKVTVLPGIDFDLKLVSVKAGIKLGETHRLWMSFSDVNNYGAAMLEYCKVYASGGCGATCTSVDAEVGFDFGAYGQYTSNGMLAVEGCASTRVGLSATQCLGLLDICCDDCCATVNLIDFTIGLEINYSCNMKAGGPLDIIRSSNIDKHLVRESCSRKCP